MDERTRKIRDLNEQLRLTGKGGKVVMVGSLAQTAEDYRKRVHSRVVMFRDFSEGRDPHGERDFGSLKVGGRQINWKIDYYDRNTDYGSEDPSDPSKTRRVLSIYFSEDQ